MQLRDRLHQNLATTNDSSKERKIDELEKIQEDIGRYRVWSQNSGAHRSGPLSLEHRLREASRMRGMVVELLEDQENTLTDGILFNFLLIQ